MFYLVSLWCWDFVLSLFCGWPLEAITVHQMFQMEHWLSPWCWQNLVTPVTLKHPPTSRTHPISDQTIQDHQWHCSKQGSRVTVHLNSAAMDSRTVFVLLWTLLSSSSSGIKLDGNGYVDVIIAIGSRVPQDDMLIDKIKVNYYYYYYYC